jgi:hypothetical protein
MRNRVFFSQEALDEWLGTGRVDLNGEDLHLKAPGRHYRIIEAVHVLAEVSGTADPHELLGKVKSRAFLAELGAELLEGSMVLGDNAYDVVQGFVGAPIGGFADHKKEHAQVDQSSDEALLVAFLRGAA